MPLCRGTHGCGEIKPDSEFYLLNDGREGVRMPCRACFAKRRKARLAEEASLSATYAQAGTVTVSLSDTDLDLY